MSYVNLRDARNGNPPELGHRTVLRHRPLAPKPAMMFHADIWMPNLKGMPTGVISLVYTDHATSEAAQDKFEGLEKFLPLTLDTGTARLIEVRTDDRMRPLSFLYRTSLNQSWDICLVVRPPHPPEVAWTAVTVWTNHKYDVHATLDLTRYASPPCRNENPSSSLNI